MSAINPKGAPAVSEVIFKYRWKPTLVASATNGEYLDQFSPSITVPSDDYEVQFRGTVGWGTATGYVNLGLQRNAVEVMTFQSNAANGVDSIILDYTDRPGPGVFVYTLQVGETVSGSVPFITSDSFIEVSLVFMPAIKYETNSTVNWTWS